MTDFTDEDKYECADREFRMRRKAYPRWVQLHKMTQAQADRELALMSAIAEDYRAKLPRLL